MATITVADFEEPPPDTGHFQRKDEGCICDWCYPFGDTYDFEPCDDKCQHPFCVYWQVT